MQHHRENLKSDWKSTADHFTAFYTVLDVTLKFFLTLAYPVHDQIPKMMLLEYFLDPLLRLIISAKPPDWYFKNINLG